MLQLLQLSIDSLQIILQMREVVPIELIRPRKRTMLGGWVSGIWEEVLDCLCEGTKCASDGLSM